MQKIAVIGLGYVGLPLAIEFAKSRPVVGFDTSGARIKELRRGYDSTLEVASEQLELVTPRLKLTNDKSALEHCNTFIITVPTPVDEVKRPDLTFLCEATLTVSRAMKRGALVIFESTVYPGCTEEICVPILEKNSGLQFNTDFFCGYSPERANPGDKEYTLTKIKKITSGSTAEAADRVDELYRSIIDAGTYRASNIKVAEAAKVIENSQRDLNIAFVNELSMIFSRINIDTIEVLEAAGSKWNFLPFKPGLVGGHCIGVDPYYLTHKSEQVGYIPQVVLAGRRINDNMGRYAARNIIRLMLKNGINIATSTVGVMGITFKENCPDVRNSKVIDLIRELESWGCRVVVTDPWGSPDDIERRYGITLGQIDEKNQVDSLIVAVGHKEYRLLTPQMLRSFISAHNPVLADLKSIYNRSEAISCGFTLFRL